MKEYKQIVIGLPAAGKTSFIAALWHAVNEENSDLAFSLDRLEGNQGYLNDIRNCWLQCTEVGRTSIDNEKAVTMHLIKNSSKEKVSLSFPDMSGESFRLHWRERKCTKEYSDLLKVASGALLFIHPEKIIEPQKIRMTNTMIEAIDDNHIPDTIRTNNNTSELTPWDPDQSPTQVVLIDLLQCIEFQYIQSEFYLSIIISAWDVCKNHYSSPEDYFYNRLPMLSQYLNAHKKFFKIKIFGISAQGGDYEKDKKTLLKEICHLNRIIVQTENSISHDITAPIDWALGNYNE